MRERESPLKAYTRAYYSPSLLSFSASIARMCSTGVKATVVEAVRERFRASLTPCPLPQGIESRPKRQQGLACDDTHNIGDHDIPIRQGLNDNGGGDGGDGGGGKQQGWCRRDKER